MMNNDKPKVYGIIGHVSEFDEEMLRKRLDMMYLNLGFIYIPDSYMEIINIVANEQIEIDSVTITAIPDLDAKENSSSDEFLTKEQKREPEHQTHKKHYKFHR